jgi:hypothetical protein
MTTHGLSFVTLITQYTRNFIIWCNKYDQGPQLQFLLMVHASKEVKDE